jgi:Flp pilus assembly protein TadG
MRKARVLLTLEVLHKRSICALTCRNCDLAKDCNGTAAIEFALVLPLLLAIALGIIQFSLIFNNITVLTNAASTGALVFSQGRGIGSPYSAAVAQVQSATGSLVQTDLTIRTSVQGANCASDAACQTALASAYPGGSASVSVSYPCPLILSAEGLQWLGISTTFCPLQVTVTEYVM